MGIRRRGREAAFQIMYGLEFSGLKPEEAIPIFFEQMGIPHPSREFVIRLVNGITENLETIDAILARHSHNWKIHRMNSVDKNILRVGIYELMFCPDIPTKVAINEAIELGKKYGTSESGAFINGIMDTVAKEVRGGDGDKKDNNC
jgi:N utilization substance protein B